MFVLCESMKWAHLPVRGGLYDQNPELLDGFMFIFGKRAEQQEAERKKDEAKNRATTRKGGASRPKR